MILSDGTPLRVGLRLVDPWLASIGEGLIVRINASDIVVKYPCVTKVYTEAEAKALRVPT